MVVVGLLITITVRTLKLSRVITQDAMTYTATGIMLVVSMRAIKSVSINTGTAASTILLDARNTTVVQTTAASIIKFPFLNG